MKIDRLRQYTEDYWNELQTESDDDDDDEDDEDDDDDDDDDDMS